MKVKVSFFGLSDMLKFKNLKKNRLEAIDNTKIEPLKNYKVNELASYYHPVKQYLIIKDIISENSDVKSFILVPDVDKGTKKLAYFKAGSYLSIYVNTNDSVASRAYAISSSPNDSLNGFYRITIKRKQGGYLSNYLLDKAKVGEKLYSTDPSGFLTFSSIRDAKNVIALAGGTGITPFLSMAKAIKEVSEDFNLTILYGVNKTSDIILKDELDEIAKSTNKVKVIYVIRDEEIEGCERGLLYAETIKKYVPVNEKYSIFISGPNPMFDFLNEELKKLNLEPKYIRMEKSPMSLPLERKEYKLKVHLENEIYNLVSYGDETVLKKKKKANIPIRTKCHLGGCGYCRSRIISGNISTTKLNKQNPVDKELNFFHPCCSYPTSDLEIEVYKY